MLKIKEIAKASEVKFTPSELAAGGVAELKIADNVKAKGSFHFAPAAHGCVAVIGVAGNIAAGQDGEGLPVDNTTNKLTVDLKMKINRDFHARKGATKIKGAGLKGLAAPADVVVEGVENASINDDGDLVFDPVDCCCGAEIHVESADGKEVVMGTGTAFEPNLASDDTLVLKPGEFHVSIVANYGLQPEDKPYCTSFIVRGGNPWNVVGGPQHLELEFDD